MPPPPPRPAIFPYTTLFRSPAAPNTPARIPAPNNDLPLLRKPISLAPPTLLSRMRHRRLLDRKSTRLNSSHMPNSYAVFCLKKNIHIPIGTDHTRSIQH